MEREGGELMELLAQRDMIEAYSAFEYLGEKA